MVLLLMLAWLAIFSFMMLVTLEGRSVLISLLTPPHPALAAPIIIEFLILILLLVPSSRAAFHRRALV
jgi:hypothetical protein